jgi:Activator of Hsp90 ATPase homolog 1-like protein
MISTAQGIENLTLNITQEIYVRASLDVTFAELLEQLGPGNETPEGKSLSMKIEPWPGGRWYRDLGDNNGHLWAHVQAIKRPTLLEFSGPLFASFPLVSNVQYRLTEVDGGTLIAFRHTALGFIQDEQREGVGKGWASMFERIRKHAEAVPPRAVASPQSR